MVRLALALTVVIYHCGFQPFGLHIGVTAVAAFFMISGYAMSAMWARWYVDRTLAFYADRLLRLYPQYALFCLCSAALVALNLGLTPQQSGSAGWVTILAHVTMVPLSFVNVVSGIHDFILIPQSWSLGSELSFYLIFPLFRWRNVLGWTTAASLAVFAVAAFGAINQDTFAYRLLPGTLFMFTLGTMIERQDTELLRRTIFALCAIAFVLTITGKMHRGYNQELLTGIIITMVFIDRFSTVKAGTVDRLAGNLSYGVYLSHFIPISILSHAGAPQSLPLRGAIVVAVSLVAAAAGHVLLDGPAGALRKRLKSCSRPAAGVPAAVSTPRFGANTAGGSVPVTVCGGVPGSAQSRVTASPP